MSYFLALHYKNLQFQEVSSLNQGSNCADSQPWDQHILVSSVQGTWSQQIRAHYVAGAPFPSRVVCREKKKKRKKLKHHTHQLAVWSFMRKSLWSFHIVRLAGSWAWISLKHVVLKGLPQRFWCQCQSGFHISAPVRTIMPPVINVHFLYNELHFGGLDLAYIIQLKKSDWMMQLYVAPYDPYLGNPLQHNAL